MRGALLALRSGAVVAVVAVVLSLLVDGAPRAVEASTTPATAAAAPCHAERRGRLASRRRCRGES